MAVRKIKVRYVDPLEMIWERFAVSIGMRIVRDDEVFASWDGASTLRVGRDSLDPDDCLAQIVLHEICHALVEGPQAWERPDWGLNDGLDGGDRPVGRVHEFAALRLQAGLNDRFGLRRFLASTTEFREYYDAIPAPDALAELGDRGMRFEIIRPVDLEEDRSAIELARGGQNRLDCTPWRDQLLAVLDATSRMVKVISPLAAEDSLWACG